MWVNGLAKWWSHSSSGSSIAKRLSSISTVPIKIGPIIPSATRRGGGERAWWDMSDGSHVGMVLHDSRNALEPLRPSQ